jgi:hypothetical protein
MCTPGVYFAPLGRAKSTGSRKPGRDGSGTSCDERDACRVFLPRGEYALVDPFAAVLKHPTFPPEFEERRDVAA